ncbi:NAD(P)-dependent oxidoreductase [Peribacillus sp. FSL H8-0477]|uniref:NAD(P)-dependent oxidoreductase n=1 Tax=Peribacillus sp. FSL H8-0477 TaxID=2921388 RepID=UPI0030FAC3BF
MKHGVENITGILEQNFLEIEPGLTRQEAMEESNRCLYCYDAPCIQACPTGIDIPSFIKKIATENLKGSATTIMSANPIGASCARVCPTEELCEGACVLNHSTKPILIGDLQRYATDWAIANQQQLFKAGEKNGRTAAIVGGGPAGLSAARELARLGYTVTIFEAESEAGGLNTYGIVSFRLPQAISYWEVDQVRNLDVQIRTNTRVGIDITVDELRTSYDAVVLAIGMSEVPKLGLDGEDADGVFDAIEFVKSTKTDVLTQDLVGKKVVVIGAGNTAIDAATCSKRLGAENVKIVYRRTQKEMTAYGFEYEFAKQDGIEFQWLTAPSKIVTNEDNQVIGLECMKMELGQVNEDGRRRPVPIIGSEHVLEADAVVRAIGQSRYISLIEEFGIAHQDGVVLLTPGSYQTSVGNIYACGDVIFGKGQGEAMVVSAAQQGKLAAYEIHQKLESGITIGA